MRNPVWRDVPGHILDGRCRSATEFVRYSTDTNCAEGASLRRPASRGAMTMRSQGGIFKTLSGTAVSLPTRTSRITRTPPFPSMANSRSWGEVRKRKLRSLRTFHKTKKPRTMPGLFTDGAGN